MNTKVFLNLKDIYKDYIMGNNIVGALRSVTMTINKGEFISIMGPSGSGKSTLMNILGCLDVPTRGYYILNGEEVQRLDMNQLAMLRNQKMGFVFQAFNLLPRTSALENVELPLLYNRKLSSGQIKKKAMEALEMVGLQDRSLHYSNQLSGGQQQRVAIARAIVNNPLILFADEPTGNLDSTMSIEIMALFQRLNENGITVIMVTHEQDIAQYSSRIILFKDGQIIDDREVENRRTAKN